jgi:hypothetical protein
MLAVEESERERKRKREAKTKLPLESGIYHKTEREREEHLLTLAHS